MHQLLFCTALTLFALKAFSGTDLPAGGPPPGLRRIAAAQPRSRLIDFRLSEPREVLARVDQSLTELEDLVHRAGNLHCDVVAFPEDTLGLGKWEAANTNAWKDVLPFAVKRMIERLGAAAAKHEMYLVVCNDTFRSDGFLRNTSFLLGRDGKEIGRYDKVNMPIHELDKKRGDNFPVFATPDLGAVGMLICYDMVFPEATRCLALAGADIIFHPTLGGAAIGDDEISRAAFRTRAVDNFVYIVVAQRGNGSMIISPQGTILAEATGADSLAVADIDPRGGREGGDAMNHQRDMRARIFRERSPTAFALLTSTNPPVLAKVPEQMTVEESVRIAREALTKGEDDFREAAALTHAGKTNEAIVAFQHLRSRYRDSWIDRVSTERLAQLGVTAAAEEAGDGLSAKYPGDERIERDPHVLFAENFESGTMAEVAKRWSEMSNRDGKPLAFSSDIPSGSSGRRSLEITATLGENTGGHLYTKFRPVDQAYARFYVKFAADAPYIHHFVTLGGYHPATSWAQGGAGEKPRGDERFTAGIEPYGNYGRFRSPGAWNFYAYWCGMKGSADGKFWGNSITPAAPALVPRDQWQCVEIMIHCNSAPEKADGELALWLDGKPIMHVAQGTPRSSWTGMGFSVAEKDGTPFEGFRWRTTNDLKVNFFWLMHYVTENAARQNHVANPPRMNRVWFDDIVIATEYIGPLKSKETHPL